MTTSPTPPVDLEALAGLLDAATNGFHSGASLPWRTDEDDNPEWDVPILDGADAYICESPDDGVRGGFDRADARLIVAAVNVLPALLDELREARAALAPDDVDGHQCVRVSGYLENVRLRDEAIRERDEARAALGRVEAVVDSITTTLPERRDDVAHGRAEVLDAIRTALTPKEPDHDHA